MPADALESAHDWVRAGQRAALATVVRTWGSSPCPPGSVLAVNNAGHFEGSVSGGCVETAVIEAAVEVMSSGAARILEFGITNERAWEVGLACGGTVRIFVQALGGMHGMAPDLLERMNAARSGAVALAVLTQLPSGRQRVVAAGDMPADLGDEERAAVQRVLQSDRCELLPGDDGEVFVQAFQGKPRLIIVGAVHIAQQLAAQAAACGLNVTVVDPRPAFSEPGRFPGMNVRTEWPDKAMAALAADRRTAVVVLSHDPKLDDPALAAALGSPAFYIGALGSKKNHAARRARLAAQGFSPEQLARIHGPVGLDIGASAPAEIAVAILAEIIQALRG